MTASNAALTLACPCVRVEPVGLHHHVVVRVPGTAYEIIWGVYDSRERADKVAAEVADILAAFVDLGLARGRLRQPTSDADPGAFFGACADTLTPAPVEDDGEIA